MALHDNSFMEYWCHRLQCKVCIPVFESNYIPTKYALFSHVIYKCCIETKDCLLMAFFRCTFWL